MNELDRLRSDYERTTEGSFWKFVIDRMREFRKTKCRDLEMAEVDTFKVIQGEIKSLDFALGSALAYEHALKEKAEKIKNMEEIENV